MFICRWQAWLPMVYILALYCMLPYCLTQICSFIYSSPAADCCCCKAIYWPRPTLMLHPSNAAAWPTFFHCHTTVAVPVSGRQAQKASKQWLEGLLHQNSNKQCRINGKSQNKSLMMRIYSRDGPSYELETSAKAKIYGIQAEKFI